MRIKRLAKTASSPAENGEVYSPVTAKRLTISLLTFGSFEHSEKLVPSLCGHLSEIDELLGITITIVLRNNNPQLDSREFDRIWSKLQQSYDRFNFILFNDGANVGYGRGHNLNFLSSECDYFLILNDDIAFSDLEWLPTAWAILENNAEVGAVGAANVPGSVSPFFGNGVGDRAYHRWPLRYIEGSVALLRASVFAEVGMFDPAYEWALFEDSDLSFRIQALGYRLEWIDIPHDHWRASSFNVLPHQLRGAILEHNRSVFFSRWNTSINANRIGYHQIYDVWSDGIGDVFVSCLHLKSYLESLTVAQKRGIIVNTSSPDVVRLLLGDDVTIKTVGDRYDLLASCGESGPRSFNSIRCLNYGLPFNIHTSLCAALGIPVATRDKLVEAVNNRRRAPDTALVPQEPFCVLHLESERADHEGRIPSPITTSLIASIAAKVFRKIVLVGRTSRLGFDDLGPAIDLRGRLSVSALIDVIAHADTFVGLESFPAHIAQVLDVKSVVFFGSVHPSFRVLSTGQTWPITRNIDCIGCYHTLLEPSYPFCMRRDLACTKDIPENEIREVMESCAALEAFDWRALELRAMELQQKFLLKMFYHPDAQKRFLNVSPTPQMRMTELIEAMIEQVRNHVLSGDEYGGASLAKQLEDVKHQMFRKDVQIQSMINLIADLRAEIARRTDLNYLEQIRKM